MHLIYVSKQKIWDEVGEPDDERDAMLLEIEKACLRIYIGKVEEAKEGRAKLQQQIDAADAEISDISVSLGVKTVNVSGIVSKIYAISPDRRFLNSLQFLMFI